MNALALLTGGMVVPPREAYDKCKAENEGLRPPAGIVKVRPEVRAKAQIVSKSTTVLTPASAVVKKIATVKAKTAKRTPWATISVADTGPAPTPQGVTEVPLSKPTVKVKKQPRKRGKRPKLSIKKKK